MTPYAPTLPAAPGTATHGPGTVLRAATGTAAPARAAVHGSGAGSRTAVAPARAAAHGSGTRPRTAAAPAATPGAVPASLTTAVVHGPCPKPPEPSATGPGTTDRSEAA
ncbi:hypothetical protein ADL06_12315 [Streptomyces sp. NRRL F-6491]|nr:hypothetical protein ADL06_12315 [Streptomyces sp. NRRL F-6491]KOX46084.1 hypothetical protein ADL08_13295 [Streptomyces sp. NRRL F-6492]